MAGYDPQKARGRHEIPDDEPAPVDGLLGPAPEEGTGPVLAHDAGRPMVRQVLPVPPRAADDGPAEPVAADAEPEPVAAEGGQPDEIIDLDAVPEPALVVDEPAPVRPTVAPATAAGSPTPAASSGSSSVRVAAVIAAIVGLVVLVLWPRRRRH